MKKILLAIACVLCAFTASAQRASSSSTSFFSTEKADQGITFGVRAGLNLSNISQNNDDGDASPDSKPGFNIGVSMDIPMLQSLYLQTGLYYTTKGAKYKESDDGDSYEEKMNPSYLEIPIMASYRYNFSEAAQLQVNFGPYFAYGLGGKFTATETYNGNKDEEKFDLFGKDKLLNRFDAGLGVGAGFTFNKFFVGLNYQFGLANIAQDTDDNNSIKNKNFSISVGYNF